MPPRECVWSPAAIDDVVEIGQFISRDNPDAAERWIAQIEERVQHLTATPFLGRRVPEFDRADLRELIIGNYRIIYRVHLEAIEVVRVIEGHRRLPEHVAAEPPE